jgi:hypothetical protein
MGETNDSPIDLDAAAAADDDDGGGAGGHVPILREESDEEAVDLGNIPAAGETTTTGQRRHWHWRCCWV